MSPYMSEHGASVLPVYAKPLLLTNAIFNSNGQIAEILVVKVKKESVNEKRKEQNIHIFH